MERIGAARRPIFVILEPDLWGYLQQSVVATTNDPASAPAAVASSGLPELADLPNTAVGFARALVRLRDRRAPNARLVLHVSPFATGVDPVQDAWSGRDDPVHAVHAADRTVAFLRKLAPLSTWDALSLDLANASAAYYEARGDPTRWWDRSAQTRPNFPYFLAYLRALTDRSGRRVILWQIPLGNQVFATMNNSPGHYQDNKAEILWANLPALVDAGVIGLLFGEALEGDTTYWDRQRDGVTNPPPIVARGCDRCNTRQSTVPDDDGGYLREQAIAYSRQPIALRGR
ncbi:MAG: hypothetical protein NZ518_11545, partial [Dehalococcoidia bacterium]|nr:hypothetical protein [Dehalococcoidia bacterium]